MNLFIKLISANDSVKYMRFNIINNIKNRIKGEEEYSVKYDTFLVLFLFFISIFMVYIAPVGFDKVFFGLLFLTVWFSKKDYFWFAFFIILAFTPGGFFTENSSEAVRRLPIFTLLPKASFAVFDIFLILIFIKAIIKGNRPKLKDVYNLKIMLILLLSLSFVTIYFGMTFTKFTNQTLRGLFFYTFIYSLPALMHKKGDIYKFMYLFFPFVFFEIISQFYLLYTGVDLITLINPVTVLTVSEDLLMGGIRPVANGFAVVISAFIFAFVFLENKNKLSSRFYVITVIFLSAFSIFISATRQSIIMLLFMFSLYYFFMSRRRSNLTFQLIFVILFFILILDYVNVWDLNKIIGGTIDRLVGAIGFKNGSVTAEDTLDYRLTERFPKLIEAIKGSLFLGYGFSDKFFEYYDGHLGGILVGLLQVGVLGYVFVVYFIINIFRVNYKYIRFLRPDNSYVMGIKVMTMGLAGFAMVNIFIDPIFIFNVFAHPQEFFILLLICSMFIHYGKKEYALKYKTMMTNKRLKNKVLIEQPVLNRTPNL